MDDTPTDSTQLCLPNDATLLSDLHAFPEDPAFYDRMKTQLTSIQSSHPELFRYINDNIRSHAQLVRERNRREARLNTLSTNLRRQELDNVWSIRGFRQEISAMRDDLQELDELRNENRMLKAQLEPSYNHNQHFGILDVNGGTTGVEDRKDGGDHSEAMTSLQNNLQNVQKLNTAQRQIRDLESAVRALRASKAIQDERHRDLRFEHQEVSLALKLRREMWAKENEKRRHHESVIFDLELDRDKAVELAEHAEAERRRAQNENQCLLDCCSYLIVNQNTPPIAEISLDAYNRACKDGNNKGIVRGLRDFLDRQGRESDGFLSQWAKLEVLHHIERTRVSCHKGDEWDEDVRRSLPSAPDI